MEHNKKLEKLTEEHNLLQNESRILLLISEIVQTITIMFNSLSQGFNPSYFALKSTYRISSKYLDFKIKIYYKISHPR